MLRETSSSSVKRLSPPESDLVFRDVFFAVGGQTKPEPCSVYARYTSMHVGSMFDRCSTDNRDFR